MTVLDLYRSCRTWLFTSVWISWRWFYLVMMHYINFSLLLFVKFNVLSKWKQIVSLKSWLMSGNDTQN
jgi:hypothetical protein